MWKIGKGICRLGGPIQLLLLPTHLACLLDYREKSVHNILIIRYGNIWVRPVEGTVKPWDKAKELDKKTNNAIKK
jgi:hypothetical protein